MKLLVNVNGVSYYTSRAAIRKKTSSNSAMQNTALWIALETMGADSAIVSTMAMYDGKMTRYPFEIKLSVV